MKKLYLCVYISCLITISSFAGTVFVKHNATGNNDGTSWMDAFTSLTVALDSAKVDDSLWVVAGTYKPESPRTEAFTMKKSVDVFGGFAGYETQFAQRDIEANKVILSGDIGIEGKLSDNSINVVVFPKGTGGTVTLDGFTIAYGYSYGSSWNDRPYGGGIWIREGNSPRITNCILYMNRAKWGAAIGINAQWNNKSKPVLINCAFINNYAWEKGGALYNSGDGAPIVINCTFSGNSAKASGGAVYSWYSHAALQNCLLIGNWAGSGGALHHDGHNNGSLYQCAFIGNYSRGDHATVKSRGLTIRNSLLWGNTSKYYTDTSMSAQISGISQSYNCIIQNCHDSVPGANNINLDPKIFDFKGYDNLAGTLDDLPYILDGSAAIDAGDSTKLSKDSYDLDKDGNTGEYFSLDLLGNDRIIGSNLDIGVYEGAFDPSTLLDLHVQAFPLNEAVKIMWEPESMDNVEGFKIYRSSVSGIWEHVADAGVQGRGYTLGMQENGTVYHYKVVAFDANGEEFGYNNIDAAVPRLEQGNAASFSGSSNFININENLFTDSETSISLWAYLPTAPVTDTMAIYAQQFVFELAAIKNTDGNYNMSVKIGDGTEWTEEYLNATILELDKWMHIVYTFDAGTYQNQLFINREMITQYTGASKPQFNRNVISIGAMKDTSGVYTHYFNGQIDELCFWNKVLSQDEINETMDKPLTGREEGIVAVWHFDEHENTYQKIAYDGGTNQNNLRANYMAYVPSGAMVPNAPLADTVVFAEPGVRFNWSSVETDISKFNVYRYSTSSSEKVLVGTVADTVFTDNTVAPKPGTFYYYVTSLDGGLNESTASEHLAITFQLPDAPTNLTATNQKESVLLEWDEVTNYDAYVLLGYDIYRADTNALDLAELITSVDASTFTYDDTGLVDSTHYFYWVKTRAEYDLVSAATPVAQVFYAQNLSPKLVKVLPDIKMLYTDLPYTVDASSVFSDPENELLTFEVSVSDGSHAETSVQGEFIHIEALGDAPFDLIIKAIDKWGDTKSTFFRITPIYETEENVSICQGDEYQGKTEAGEYVFELTSVNGCDSIATVNVTILPVHETTEDVTICDGESYEGYTESTTFTRTLVAETGCDSIVTTNLTVAPEYVVDTAISICRGQEYRGENMAGTYQFDLQSESNCDSTVTVELSVHSIFEVDDAVSICEGENFSGYTEAGDYTLNLLSEYGCDSIVNLNLTVNPAVSSSEEVTICFGEEYEGNGESGEYTRTLTSETGCDSIVTTQLTVLPFIGSSKTVEICEGDSYEGYAESTTFTQTFTAESGCDSVVTIELIVNPVYEEAKEVTICEGGNYEGETEAGTYTFDYQSVKGCDSIVTVELTVNSFFEVFETVSICAGDEYEGHTEAGDYSKTLISSVGCDSIVNLTLIVKETTESTETVTICAGENYEGYDETGEYTRTLVNTAGCDSIVTTQLAVLPKIESFITIEICDGESYEGYSESTTFTQTFIAESGCDSIVTVELIVNPSFEETKEVTICEGGNYKGETEAGTYIFEYQSVKGCDSIVTVALTVKSFFEVIETVSICEGEEYDGHTEAGEYTKTLVSTAGCDSIVNLTLTVNQISESFETVTICQGESYEGYTESGEYTRTLENTSGCDSIITTELIVAPVYEENLSVTICQGDQYKGKTETGVYTFEYESVFGCDSIVIVNLEVVAFIETFETVTICQGESYNGYSKSGNYIDSLTSAFGCDSLVNINLTVAPIETAQVDTVLSAGQTIFIGGVDVSEAGEYEDTLQSEFGCDSIVTYTITVNDAPTSINNSNAVKVSIAPVPVKDVCTVQFTGQTSEVCTVLIQSTDGTTVIQEQLTIMNDQIELDLSTISAGFYVVTVKTNTMEQIIKIIKE